MTFKRFLWKGVREAALILLMAAGLAYGIDLFREGTPAAISHAPQKAEGSRSITIEEALRRFEEGSAVFVDARPAIDFQAGRIKGAISLPDQDFDAYIGPFLAKTPEETLLITYCEGKSCPLSRRLAEKLMMAGYEKVFHLEDGWGQWKKRGLPLEKGVS